MRQRTQWKEDDTVALLWPFRIMKNELYTLKTHTVGSQRESHKQNGWRGRVSLTWESLVQTVADTQRHRTLNSGRQDSGQETVIMVHSLSSIATCSNIIIAPCSLQSPGKSLTPYKTRFSSSSYIQACQNM